MYYEAKITVRRWTQLTAFLHSVHKALWQTPITIQNLACNSGQTDIHTKLPLKIKVVVYLFHHAAHILIKKVMVHKFVGY